MTRTVMPALSSICEMIIDSEHKTAPTQFDGNPLIRTPNIGKGRFILANAKRVSEETYKAWTRRAIPRTNDLILAREAPVGNVAIVSANLNPCLGQRTVLIRPNKDKVDPAYLVYLLLGDEVQGTIQSLSTGATVAHLNMSDIRNLRLPTLPPLPTQRKIASVLSAYDDLIENNTRRIEILEEMAQRIYREWFVHFRFPGHEKVRMVNSELGLIPEGWELSAVKDLLDYQIGGGWGKEEQSEEYPDAAYVIRGTDIPSARHTTVNNCPLRFHKLSNLASRRLQPEDIVFEVSGGSKDQPVGRALLVGGHLLRAFDEDVMCASFCKLLRPKQSRLLSPLLYLHLLEIYGSKRIEKYQVQSTGISNFKFQYFLESELIVVPTTEVQTAFRELVAPLFKAVWVLGARNTNLRRTRDLLLPKLISGEVDVERVKRRHDL